MIHFLAHGFPYAIYVIIQIIPKNALASKIIMNMIMLVVSPISPVRNHRPA